MCCGLWASEGAAFGWRWDPCVSYQDIGLLPLLLVLAARELMATVKPTPRHPRSHWGSRSVSS